MMIQKPAIPRGTRDFSPSEMVRRNFIFNTIKDVFRLYGYQPIETPAMENLTTLLGKYGEEGDKLLFRILNSGDFLSGVPDEVVCGRNSGKIIQLIADKGLRYDLTVPTARFVVQHQSELIFPFKRYQIQPVWRADRPQKGRYREFYQCDVDVIGSNSLMNEAELVQIICDVFKRLRITIKVKVNHRKILAGIAEYMGVPEKMTEITTAVDKLEKSDLGTVEAELFARGIQKSSVEKLKPLLQMQGTTHEKINLLKEILIDSGTGLTGINEIMTLSEYMGYFGISREVELDLALARGLNYYTGVIIEVKAVDFDMGSICGGGRYDDLAGIFGLPGISGVGVSFGAERIYDVLAGLELFPPESVDSTRIMFVNFGKKEEFYCIPVISKLRESGINTELYPEPAKLKKQLSYANGKHIPYVALAGTDEMAVQKFTLKELTTGIQQLVTPEEMIKILS